MDAEPRGRGLQLLLLFMHVVGNGQIHRSTQLLAALEAVGQHGQPFEIGRSTFEIAARLICPPQCPLYGHHVVIDRVPVLDQEALARLAEPDGLVVTPLPHQVGNDQVVVLGVGTADAHPLLIGPFRFIVTLQLAVQHGTLCHQGLMLLLVQAANRGYPLRRAPDDPFEVVQHPHGLFQTAVALQQDQQRIVIVTQVVVLVFVIRPFHQGDSIPDQPVAPLLILLITEHFAHVEQCDRLHRRIVAGAGLSEQQLGTLRLPLLVVEAIVGGDHPVQDVHVFRIAFPHHIAFERTPVITEPLVVAPRIEIEVAFGNIQPVGFEYFPLAHPFDNAPGLAEIRKSIFVEIIFGEQAVRQLLLRSRTGTRRKEQEAGKQEQPSERQTDHRRDKIIRIQVQI